ncbi:MAG TPA: DUF4143 domain-containing protein [Spirochaetales bacterium]|nr:DUF4143 domain-containing protein [Spirochaetales bacterium]HPG85955.1 DUF4143 domain-containing protein [Spirochaetales bacterium]HPM72500.1 DUF4143 domain-containing protein [Spirochaetales bacterium]
MGFIQRSCVRSIHGLLASHRLVLVEGPPRSGRSTIAAQVAAGAPGGGILVDARRPEGRDVLADPASASAARLIVVDGAGRREAERVAASLSAFGEAERTPRFALIGGPFGHAAASRAATGRAPASRVAATLDAPILRVCPLSLFEAGSASMRRLWLRGGFPQAFMADSDQAALAWLRDYAASLAGDSLSAWGVPRDAALVSGLLDALAASSGRAFNENAAARSLGVSRPTIERAVAAVERAGLLLRVPAWRPRDDIARDDGPPGTARAIRSPAIHLADSGLLHALHGAAPTLETAATAASWTSFVIGQALSVLRPGTAIFHYASADGAALELVVAMDGRPVVAAAARRHRPSSAERAVSYAARAIGATERYIVVPEGGGAKLPGGFIVTGLRAFLDRLAAVP